MRRGADRHGLWAAKGTGCRAVATAASLAAVLRSIAYFAASCAFLAACAPAKTPPPYVLDVSMKELMNNVINPAGFAIWNASGEEETEKGTVSKVPSTPEGWAAMRNGAVQLAEAGNAMMLPGRARDDGDWMKFSRGMSEAALMTRAAIDAKDGAAVFTTGGALYETCTACHAKYYLPYVDPKTGETHTPAATKK